MKKWLILGLVLLLVPVVAKADGMVIPQPSYYVDESGQKAVLWFDGKKETLILSTSFSGNAEDFAWVIPVPAKPEVSSGKDELFTALEDYTRPQYTDRYPAPMMGVNMMSIGSEDYSQKVTVLETKKVDVYDVAVLEATDGTALRKWLEDNGYEYPATKDLLLQYYINKKWYFVAAKVTGPAADYVGTSLRTGHATPLTLSFETTQPVYPLKISGPGAKTAEGQKIAAYSFETGYQGWTVGYVYPTPIILYDQVGQMAPSKMSASAPATRLTQVGLATDPVWQGKNSLQMTRVEASGTTEDYVYANVFGLTTGKQYTFSAVAMVNKDIDGKVKIRVKSGDRVVAESKPEAFGPTKQSVKLEVTFVADLSSFRFDLVATGLGANQSVYWDAVQIEQGLQSSNFAYEVMPGGQRVSPTNTQIPIVLYVFANHKKTVPGFTTEYAGDIPARDVEKLAYNDDGKTWMKTNKKMYLTKLTRNMPTAQMTDDLIIRDAADNTAVGGVHNSLDGWWRPVLVLGIPLAAELWFVIRYWYSKKKKENT